MWKGGNSRASDLLKSKRVFRSRKKNTDSLRCFPNSLPCAYRHFGRLDIRLHSLILILPYASQSNFPKPYSCILSFFFAIMASIETPACHEPVCRLLRLHSFAASRFLFTVHCRSDSSHSLLTRHSRACICIRHFDAILPKLDL